LKPTNPLVEIDSSVSGMLEVGASNGAPGGPFGARVPTTGAEGPRPIVMAAAAWATNSSVSGPGFFLKTWGHPATQGQGYPQGEGVPGNPEVRVKNPGGNAFGGAQRGLG